MTEELFRHDAYLKTCTATVTAVSPAGIELDRTIFYPMGGGQLGDTGRLLRSDGSAVAIADTRKGETPGSILHVPAEAAPLPEIGETVTAEIDWERRHRLMRMHTCLHLLCALVPGGVTGGQVSDGKGRLDFELADQVPDKAALTEALNALIAADHRVAPRWISDDELAAQPDLVRTMSVKPPTGLGKVRLLSIEGVDLQPCGGTHVQATGEIGPVTVEKVENKGKRNRRVVIGFAA